MLKNAPVNVVLPATDIERARSFYAKNLGLTIGAKGPDGGFLVNAGKGTALYVYPTQAPRGEATQAAFVVDDVEKTVKALRANGVAFQDYDMPGLKTVNGVATMNGMKSAWFKDSEGNTLCVGDMRF